MTKQLLTIAFCLTLLATVVNNANAQTAGASYNVDTGEVIFTIGDNISVVGLASLGGAAFDTGVAPRIGADVSPAQFNNGSLAYFDANGLPAGTFNQGLVLPAGLGVSDLGFEYTPIGAPTATPAIEFVGGIVPEPASLMLASLGALALIQTRRRS